MVQHSFGWHANVKNIVFTVFWVTGKGEYCFKRFSLTASLSTRRESFARSFCECLHSTATAHDRSFTETRLSDHRQRTTTPGLCFIILGDFNKAIFPVNCTNIDRNIACPTSDIKVIYWITVIQQENMHITLSHGQL